MVLETMNEKTKERLVKLRRFFFEQKYRFDLGQQFLTFLNFTLLIVAASDKLQTFLGIPKARTLILILVPLAYLGMWSFGYFMDKVVRAAQMAERESMKRSTVWTAHNAQMDRIEKELGDVKDLLLSQKAQAS